MVPDRRWVEIVMLAHLPNAKPRMENVVPREGSKLNAFAAFSLILLRHGERYLLLRRAETKRFAPGRWTGIGGSDRGW